ncbi:teosinte glume architecture 1 [Panicum miliaceum]|uniref:Teosinte glume architecture 1 n=1 Tax=Panicum miliaceum TaxID=4540 RepID=A0A3L6RNU1_PANMI|nr:teosinte glume architecture 1 [Panicum miliaceum]
MAPSNNVAALLLVVSSSSLPPSLFMHTLPRYSRSCLCKFHLLAEFDDTKRSCRKRLDGHNRRRRKPQPDTMASASFIASQQGTRFSPFAAPRLDANWPGVIKTEESPYYTHQIPLGTSSRHHFVGSSSAYAKENRRFPFLQEGEINFATGVVLEAPASARQPVLKTAAPPESSSGSTGGKMFSDGLTRVLDSDCALSLLSAPANSSGIDVSRMVRPTEHVPMAQPVVPGLQFGSPSWFSRPQASAGGGAAAATRGFPSCPAVEGGQQLNTVLSSNDNEMNYSGMFHVGGGPGGGGEGSSDGTSSSLPFSWQ